MAIKKADYVKQRSGAMSLHKRVSLILVAVMAMFIIASNFILSRTIIPTFENIEDQSARKDLIRVHQAIATDLTNLLSITGDWSGWDDSYAFVLGVNDEFIDTNLDETTLDILGINIILFHDADDKLVWGSTNATGMGSAPDVADAMAQDLLQRYPLTSHTGLRSANIGFADTLFGPMIISSMPILTSDREGPIAGNLIMAKFLDEHLVSVLRDRTEVKFTWYRAENASLEIREVIRDLPPDQELSYVQKSEDDIRTYGLLLDFNDEPLLVLRTATPRNIAALGTQTMLGAMIFLGIAGAVMTVVIWFLLRRSIVTPMANLAQHIVTMRVSGDLARRLGMQRSDEIGVLAAEFDELTAELHSTRQSLQDQSYKAGKAELAAEVLHNIRNAMTPLVNSIDRVMQSAKHTDELRIQQAVDELVSDDCPAERRLKMARYIELALEELKRMQGDESAELRVASTQAKQIQMIMADQEKLAHVRPVIEALDLNDVISESIHVIPKEKSTDVSVQLNGDLDGHRVNAHRISLLQVISNMLVNAYESIQKTSRGSGNIEFTAESEKVDEKPMIRLTVRDDGAGIEQSKLNKIFRRGFTTKNGGSGGLGLHWCANAVAGMGGRIHAESEGEGQGAAFHVLLPAAQEGHHS